MQHLNKAVVAAYTRDYKSSVENFLKKDLEKDTRRVDFFSDGYHKTGSSLLALNVASISEGKEGFTHRLIRLMCGTRDDPDNPHNR